MQKIKRELYDKIIQSNLSKLEISLLFYLAKRCDAHGEVKGIYYAEVSEEIGCYVATFYDIRNSLLEKGFITCTKNNSADIDMTLIGNSFMDENGQEEYKNYIDINIAIFQDQNFFKLKAGAIKVAMELIKRVAAQEGITASNSLYWNAEDAEKRRKLFYKHGNIQLTLAKCIHVGVRMIQKYLTLLQKWIGTYQSKEGSHDVITVMKSALGYEEYQVSPKKKKRSYAERVTYLHFVKTICRRNKIKAEEQHLSDTADLIRQYATKAKESSKNIFLQISKAILYTRTNMLNSYNVHSTLRRLLAD